MLKLLNKSYNMVLKLWIITIDAQLFKENIFKQFVLKMASRG